MSGRYLLYGLVVESTLDCPFALEAPPGSPVDVRVVEGTVPVRLPGATVRGPGFQAAPQRTLLTTGHGRFLVEGHGSVTLQRRQGGREEILRLALAGIVLATVLRHRGALVLHASAVRTAAGALAVAGTSGAGKSSTVAALLERGCAPIADDVVALYADPEGNAWVVPGPPQLHLVTGAAPTDAVDPSRGYATRRNKAVLPLAGAVPEGAPLRTLVLLEVHDERLAHFDLLHGAAKFDAVLEAAYGPLTADEQVPLLPLVRAIAERCDVVRLQRPRSGLPAPQVAELLLREAAP